MSATSTTSGEAVHAVRPFAELGKGDVDFAGGKGANLGELTRAGLPVPPGFVIGAPAYVAFCKAQGLRDRIAAGLRELDWRTQRRSQRRRLVCARWSSRNLCQGGSRLRSARHMRS